MRKNGFLTFCFAGIPGAGQMYLGYMKRGSCLMTLLCLDIAVMAFLRMEALAFLLPIIWFFSFFDTFNLRNQMIAGNAPEDKLLFNIGGMLSNDWQKIFNTRHRILGGALIFIGAALFYNMFIRNLIRYMPEWTHAIFRNIPTIVIAIIIITLGIYLIRGKKPEQPRLTDDLKPFEGEKTEK